MHSPERHEIVSINRNDEKFTAIVDGPLDSFRGTLEPKITATIAPRINVEQTIISIIRTCSFKITALSNNDHIIVKVAKEEATAWPHNANTANETIADKAINEIPIINRRSKFFFGLSLLLLCDSFWKTRPSAEQKVVKRAINTPAIKLPMAGIVYRINVTRMMMSRLQEQIKQESSIRTKFLRAD